VYLAVAEARDRGGEILEVLQQPPVGRPDLDPPVVPACTRAHRVRERERETHTHREREREGGRERERDP
jgi:hypothetical protein